MAFQELKQYLSHPPIMSNPVMDEVLFTYIAVALYAISLVLIRVDSGIQRSRGALFAIGKGDIGRGPCYKKASPLLLSEYCGRTHLASTQVST